MPELTIFKHKLEYIRLKFFLETYIDYRYYKLLLINTWSEVNHQFLLSKVFSNFIFIIKYN